MQSLMQLYAVNWSIQCLFKNLQELPWKQVIGSASVINLDRLESLLKLMKCLKTPWSSPENSEPKCVCPPKSHQNLRNLPLCNALWRFCEASKGHSKTSWEALKRNVMPCNDLKRFLNHLKPVGTYKNLRSPLRLLWNPLKRLETHCNLKCLWNTLKCQWNSSAYSAP